MESQNQDNDTPQSEWIVFLMATYIYNNHEQFMSANNGQVREVLSDDNTLCKMMKDQYTDLDDNGVRSMSLALLLYLYMVTANPSLMSDELPVSIDHTDNMEIGDVD